MPDADVIAALRALRALERVSRSFRELPVHHRTVSATVASPLRAKPSTAKGLRWSSSTGKYRELWVAPWARGVDETLFHLYFGPWGRAARQSAYVVLFGYGAPQLEVRLSPRRAPETDSVVLTHNLAFFGKRYKEPAGLRDRALVLAKRAGVPVDDRRAVLGSFDARSGVLRPGVNEVLRRILACGLIKRSLVDANLAGYRPGKRPRRKPKPPTPGRESYPKGRRAKIDLLLDQRFEAHGLHNRLVNRLSERLRARGYLLFRHDPFDLIARRGKRIVILEAKAWRRDNLQQALRAAVGQLMYYRHAFQKVQRHPPFLVAMIPYRPSADLIDFVEGTAGIGLVWSTGDRRFAAGPVALRFLPGLLD